jgi:hypothetical protein
MTRTIEGAAGIVGAAAVAVVLSASPVWAQSGNGAMSTSAPKAKELGELMKAQKLTVFASRDSAAPDRFIAVTFIPEVQILLVAAAYSRPSDIEYYMYKKDYATAYKDLSSSTLASDRFSVEDLIADGLVAVPGKGGIPDVVTSAATKLVCEGPLDPRRRNDKRMPAEAYHKAFNEVDQRYAALLDQLIAELKKSGGGLAVASPVR